MRHKDDPRRAFVRCLLSLFDESEQRFWQPEHHELAFRLWSEGATLKEAGDAVGLTPERIRQTNARFLYMLREALR